MYDYPTTRSNVSMYPTRVQNLTTLASADNPHTVCYLSRGLKRWLVPNKFYMVYVTYHVPFVVVCRASAGTCYDQPAPNLKSLPRRTAKIKI